MNQKIGTVIFDLDGTLVDSQPAALGATIEALSRFGVTATEAELRVVFGGGARKLLGHFLERDLGPDRAGELLEEAIEVRSGLQVDLTPEVVLLPGVKDLLGLLKDGMYRMAVATMSSRVVVDNVLTHHGIDSYFDAALTVDDVTRGKPDPEILIKTVDCLGVQIGHALYVGDSSHDLDAAVSAGMLFILVDSGLYVRGDAREKLRAATRQNGFPIVGLDEIMDIGEIVRGQL
jgi:phosphoglycolate phosphatase-like HAD superfamily hydrolase